MNLQPIQSVLEQAVKTGAIAGAVAAATSRTGTMFIEPAGRQSLDAPTPMQADSVFWVASMTKAITTVAALMLVESGQLALDAPLGPLLPDLANPQVLEGFSQTGEPQLRPAQGAITLRHLLTHTAGFSYEFGNANLARYLKQTKSPGAATGLLAGLRQPLMFNPGSSWEYGINVDWAGRAVEEASGLKLDAFFEQKIFAPLGMVDTQFFPTPAQGPRRAAMHTRDEQGQLSAIQFDPRPAPEFLGGGGGLYSTAVDYLAFMRMLLNQGAGLLAPATVAQMGCNQIGHLRAGTIGSANPALMSRSDFYPGMDSKWGLGFVLNPQPGPFGRSAGSLAWAGLPNCYYWLDMPRGLAALIMMQVLPFGDQPALQTYTAFERAFYASL